MVKALPAYVVGEKSPYPTVVDVTIKKYTVSIAAHPSRYWYALSSSPSPSPSVA